ncbi:hypothetical protein FRB90_004903, partial [Tulasnella sp. 427]
RDASTDGMSSAYSSARSSFDRQSLKRGASAVSFESSEPSPKVARFNPSASSLLNADYRSISPPSRDSPVPHRLPVPIHRPSFKREDIPQLSTPRDVTPTYLREPMDYRPNSQSPHSRTSSSEMTVTDTRRPPSALRSSVVSGGASGPQQSGTMDTTRLSQLLDGLKDTLSQHAQETRSSDAMDISDDDEVKPAVVVVPRAPCSTAGAVVVAQPVETPSLVLPAVPMSEPPQKQEQNDSVRPEITSAMSLVADPIPIPQTVGFASSPTASAVSCPSFTLIRRQLQEERTLPKEFSKDVLPATIKSCAGAIDARNEWEACKREVQRLRHTRFTFVEPPPNADPRLRAGENQAAEQEARDKYEEAVRKAESRLRDAEARYQEKMSEADWSFMQIQRVMLGGLENRVAELQRSAIEALQAARSPSPIPALGLQIEPQSLVDANATSYIDEERLREVQAALQSQLADLHERCSQAFLNLDGKRMDLAEVFDDKFEELGRCVLRHEDLDMRDKSIKSLEDRVKELLARVTAAAASTGEVDKVGQKVSGLEKSHATGMAEFQKRAADLSARIAVVEKEWRAFDAFEKFRPDELIDINDPRHSLRTKLKNMDGNMTMKIEFLETSIELRINELEAAHKIQIDNITKAAEKKQASFESSTDQRLSAFQAKLNEKVEASKARAEKLVTEVENTVSSKVESMESAFLAKLEAFQASMNQKLSDMLAAHALESGKLKEQTGALAEENQTLRAALEEEREARLSAQENAGMGREEIREKLATVQQGSIQMREEVDSHRERLNLCTLDVLELQATVGKCAAEAETSRMLRRNFARCFADVEEQSCIAEFVSSPEQIMGGPSFSHHQLKAEARQTGL